MTSRACPPCVALLVAAAAPAVLLAVTAAIAPAPAPASQATSQIASLTVSPDRIDDVAAIPVDTDAFPVLDNFAWRAFIALNWPALTNSKHRGMPDRDRTLGDAGARVWETFKARYELFQVGADDRAMAPPPWATYDAANPCGPGAARMKTLATFEPFMDFNQFGFMPGVATNPLVAQNRTYTRYETRLNRPHYSALALSGWTMGRGLPDPDHPAQMPAGSIAVKAAWRLLTHADTAAVRARYYVVENANVVDVARTLAARKPVCSNSDVALVGLHIVVRTANRPQGLWSSFEHVDNVPPIGAGEAREPDASAAGVPYSYFNALKPTVGLWPRFRSPATLPVSLDHPPAIDPEPMQVVRRHPIHPSTMVLNRAYWALPQIRGTVWENYMLVANQWPTRTKPVEPYNDGLFYPERRKENLVNTTIETYLQDPPSSCMGCHHVFNARGRDFVGLIGSFR